MKPLTVAVAGIGAWSAQFANWPAMRDASTRDATGTGPSTRPVPLLLPPAERRRAPDGVAVALEVAREALDGATFDATALASVFASAHGELAIVDYLCATLASDPLLLSPTRFHHSVHNAAAGYWSIATKSLGPTTALAAGEATVGLALLEAATQVVADLRPVLLVLYDTPGVGPLADVAPNTALFGAALLLVPVDTQAGSTRLAIAFEQMVSPPPIPHRADLGALAATSPAAHVVALLEALDAVDDTVILFAAGPGATVSVTVLVGGTPDPVSGDESIE